MLAAVKRKMIERAYLELARTCYADFPSGTLIEGEAPDFVLPTPGRTFGFEVTQLFQPPSTSRFPPREIEAFREEVVRRAEDIYAASGGLPVDVNAYFSIRPATRQDKEALAQSLSDFVRGHYPAERQVLLFRENEPQPVLPRGFGSISIARPLGDQSRVWFTGGVGETILLTRELLATTISEKNSLVAHYLSHVDEVWLLIVTDLFPSSSSFSVPREVQGWSFSHKFDRLLLLSREDSKVWALQGAER